MDRRESGETKDKILDSARLLFSKYGFEGTSIRDIARESKVNLAAINYHFKSKENLYWEIYWEAYHWLEQGIQNLAKESWQLEDLAEKVFNYLLEGQTQVRNTFKFMMSESVLAKDDRLASQTPQKGFGLPGEEVFGRLIEEEVGGPLPVSALQWGVKSVFGLIFHFAVLCSSSKLRSLYERDPLYSLETLRKDVRRQARSAIEYIKAHKDEF